MNPGYVIDASVALTWLLPGEDTPQTLQLRDRAVDNTLIELFVPPTFWYEVANVLWVAVRRSRISQHEAAEALDSLLGFKFTVCSADPINCLTLSIAHNLAVYDSAYLCLAMEYQVTLWTVDNALVKAAKRLNIPVEPLPVTRV
jgi:predicted nucleic acid-binding protein